MNNDYMSNMGIPSEGQALNSNEQYTPNYTRDHRIAVKQGHSCCGCCCDTRRAVIIVNLIMICFNVLSTLILITGIDLLVEGAAQADDDTVKNTATELKVFPEVLFVIWVCLQILFNVLGILGAINYSKWMIVATLLGYILSFIGNLLELNLAGMILSGFFAYPHYFFLSEMHFLIMTPDNYPNEVQSCFCV